MNHFEDSQSPTSATDFQEGDIFDPKEMSLAEMGRNFRARQKLTVSADQLSPAELSVNPNDLQPVGGAAPARPNFALKPTMSTSAMTVPLGEMEIQAAPPTVDVGDMEVQGARPTLSKPQADAAIHQTTSLTPNAPSARDKAGFGPRTMFGRPVTPVMPPAQPVGLAIAPPEKQPPSVVGRNQAWEVSRGPSLAIPEGGGPIQPVPNLPPETTGTIRAGQPDYLNRVATDVRYGTGGTVPGRFLKAAGAPGIAVGVPPGVSETVGGPVIGPVEAGHGLGKLFSPDRSMAPAERVAGFNEAVGGALKTVAPALAMHPEFLVGLTKYGVGQAAISKAARELGADPQTAEAIANAILIYPAAKEAFGKMADIKTGYEAIPSGGGRAGATAFGGKVGVAGQVTPEAFQGRVKVGPWVGKVDIPRRGAPEVPGEPARLPGAVSNAPTVPVEDMEVQQAAPADIHAQAVKQQPETVKTAENIAQQVTGTRVVNPGAKPQESIERKADAGRPITDAARAQIVTPDEASKQQAVEKLAQQTPAHEIAPIQAENLPIAAAKLPGSQEIQVATEAERKAQVATHDDYVAVQDAKAEGKPEAEVKTLQSELDQKLAEAKQDRPTPEFLETHTKAVAQYNAELEKLELAKKYGTPEQIGLQKRRVAESDANMGGSTLPDVAWNTQKARELAASKTAPAIPSKAEVSPVAATPSETSKSEPLKKGSRVTVDGKPGTVRYLSTQPWGKSAVKLDAGGEALVSHKDVSKKILPVQPGFTPEAAQIPPKEGVSLQESTANGAKAEPPQSASEVTQSTLAAAGAQPEKAAQEVPKPTQLSTSVEPQSLAALPQAKGEQAVQGVTAPVSQAEPTPKHGAIAFDLDKTLAQGSDPDKVGAPIPEQVAQAKQMLAEGKDVWIYTSRAGMPDQVPKIKAWTKEHLGQELPVTNVKHPGFATFIDDRAEKPGEAVTGAPNEQRIGAELPQPNAPESGRTNAIRERGPEGLLPREQEKVGEAGSQRLGVGRGQQGAEEPSGALAAQRGAAAVARPQEEKPVGGGGVQAGPGAPEYEALRKRLAALEKKAKPVEKQPPTAKELSAKLAKAAPSPVKGEVAQSGTPVENQREGLVKGESGQFTPSAVAAPVSKFYDADVKPSVERAGEHIKSALGSMVTALYPRIEDTGLLGKALGVGVPRDAVDAMMQFKGDREHAAVNFGKAFEDAASEFDKVPESQRVDFYDRMQTGRKQETPELQAVADGLQKAMEIQRGKEEEAANLGRPKFSQIELTRKDNYAPNRWDRKPGGGEDDDEVTRIANIGRRPLQGTQRYNKQQSYTMKSGMEAGGVPVTTNPVRQIAMRLADGMQFVTARQYWHAIGEMGMRQWLEYGKPIPEGFAEVSDPISRVVSPNQRQASSDSDLALTQRLASEEKPGSGRWVVDKNAARLLNNYLSKDYIRGNPIGSGLMALKNASTMVELALSPFHAVFETVEAASSQMSTGLLKLWNLGVREADPWAMIDGLKDIATSPLAPITMARRGGALNAYVAMKAKLDALGIPMQGATIRGNRPEGMVAAIKEWDELRKEKNVQRLMKQYPDLDQMVDDMFTGGMTFGQHRDYQTKTIQTIRENWTADNPIGAVMRSIPAANQTLMAPLFQHYIPSLKYGQFLEQYSEQLAENAADLASGKVTRAEIARKVVDSVENRFGELNFDNLFWNKTLKSAMQFAFRSVTWKLGNVREIGGSVPGQLGEGVKAAKALYDVIPKEMGGGGGSAGAKGKDVIPKLDMHMSWVLSFIALSSVIGSVLAKIRSGKYPWEWAEEDKNSSLLRETMHPRTGELDQRGEPVRLSLPTYWKDVEHASKPMQYVVGSLSATAGRAIDVAQNRDYFNNYVYNPNDDLGTQVKQIGKYVAPTPFGIGGYLRSKGEGVGTTTRVMSSFGFPRAPRSLDFTPAESMAHDILQAKRGPKTPEEQEETRDYLQRRASGELSPAERKSQIKGIGKSFLVKTMQSLVREGATMQELRRIEDKASPEEKSQIHIIMLRARMNDLRKRIGRPAAQP
jgi:hypothetical protein